MLTRGSSVAHCIALALQPRLWLPVALLKWIAIAAAAGCVACSSPAPPSIGPTVPATSETPAITAPPAPPAPTVPADGGFGTWTLNDATQTSTVTFDKDGTSSAAKEAAACVKAMKAPPVIWVVATVENKSGKSLTPNGVTIVTADGTELKATNVIETLGNAYGNATDSAARTACVDTAQKLADAQLENGVSGGAKLVALETIPTTVTGIKSVTFNGYGNTGSLTYGG
jgi:hypothetical protein